MRRLLIALALLGAAGSPPTPARADVRAPAALRWIDVFGRLHVLAGGVESVYQWDAASGAWELLYTTTR